MPLSRIFSVTNMSFNAICENKILAKISGFTVTTHKFQLLIKGKMVKIKIFLGLKLSMLYLFC